MYRFVLNQEYYLTTIVNKAMKMNKLILLASLIFSSIMLSNCGDDDNAPDTVTIQGSQVTTRRRTPVR